MSDVLDVLAFATGGGGMHCRTVCISTQVTKTVTGKQPRGFKEDLRVATNKHTLISPEQQLSASVPQWSAGVPGEFEGGSYISWATWRCKPLAGCVV